MTGGTEGGSRLIAGRYRLGDQLGRGGMGTVWQATDELLGRQVAVKELHFGGDEPGLPAADAQLRRERALREARTVAQLVHPHVIIVHDIVEEPGAGLSYIIMERIDGDSLADRIAADGPFDVREAARIGLALVGALRMAHERGVLHRDLKPDNVLLEAGTGRVVLTDFGIARLDGGTTITDAGSFVGSPEYTAPERMEGRAAGPASDLWSLGVLLCTAVSGESPFHRDSLSGVLCAVMHDPIVPPAAAGPLLPVVRRLLERDPERRLGAAEAERLLLAFLATGMAPDPAAPCPATHPHIPLAAKPSRFRAGGVRAGGVRGALVASMLVAVMAGAGAATATLFLRDGDGDGDSKGGGRTDFAPTRTVTSTVSTRPGGAVPAPTGTADAPRTPPPGYRRVTDPAGFTLAVPGGYDRSADDNGVSYLSPDKSIRIGVRQQSPVAGGPLGEMRRAHAKGPDTHPGYRAGKVTRTTHNGLAAALWEFVRDGFEPGDEDRHTYDLCWEEGGLMYDVWVSAPVSRQDDGKRHFDTALDSFARG
ncbi:serine/threonine-protein kinase [Streptomyces flavidovirens]|uniref:serine/threonine-protein kinase n=1 Tax=Streptomyces flavidovirens TaxID=67298 RepID=UPI0036D09056